MKLNVWDIGGQRKIRTFWKKYLENTDVLVSDFISLLIRFISVFGCSLMFTKWLEVMLRCSEKMYHKKCTTAIKIHNIRASRIPKLSTMVVTVWEDS